MHIEVVFALPERQELVAVELEEGATVADAIERSSIAALFPEHDIGRLPVGIWGRMVERDHVLEDGDRVEIYRPLAIDPREQRRALAAKGKSMGAADKPEKTGRGSNRIFRRKLQARSQPH
jgi:uncharacterized protein